MAGGILFELQFFGKAFLCGAALAFLYGGLKVFRRLVFHGTVWMAAEDLAYWLLCGFLIFPTFLSGCFPCCYSIFSSLSGVLC